MSPAPRSRTPKSYVVAGDTGTHCQTRWLESPEPLSICKEPEDPQSAGSSLVHEMTAGPESTVHPDRSLSNPGFVRRFLPAARSRPGSASFQSSGPPGTPLAPAALSSAQPPGQSRPNATAHCIALPQPSGLLFMTRSQSRRRAIAWTADPAGRDSGSIGRTVNLRWFAGAAGSAFVV